MRAAVYVRVSTQEQTENYSIESQKERLEAFCKSKGWAIYDTYIDGGYSGSNMDRPGLQKLLSDLKDIDAVVVYRLDRLSRSQRDTLELIEEYFLENAVDFVSVTETLDTSTPFGKAMIGILSVFAQLERETIRERMRNGLVKRAQEGYRAAGGDYDPAGYSRRDDGEIVLKPDEAEHIKKAYDLYEELHSITKVQKRLKEMGINVWRFRRYRDILSNKLYIGYVSFAGEYYKGRHEPIIDTDQFDRVQALLERHKGPNAHKAKESLLTNLLTCKHCGNNYVTYSSQDKRNGKTYKYRYYICRARRFPSEYDSKCMNKNWNAQKLEEKIIKEIQLILTDREQSNKEYVTIDYQKQIKKLDDKIQRVLDLYTEGTIEKDVLNKQIRNLNQQKEEYIELERAEKHTSNELTNEDINNLVINLNQSDFNTKQASIQKLINQVIIDKESFDIEWNF